MAKKKRKNFQKTKQEKLEQEQALAYRHEQKEKRNRTIKAILVGVLCVVLILAFCFPAFTMLIR